MKTFLATSNPEPPPQYMFLGPKNGGDFPGPQRCICSKQPPFFFADEGHPKVPSQTPGDFFFVGNVFPSGIGGQKLFENAMNLDIVVYSCFISTTLICIYIYIYCSTLMSVQMGV